MSMTKNWSEQQKAIFGWFASGRGNLVVRARAGTGKTTTILEGISYAAEKKIVLVAFNKKNAVDLQSKLRNQNAEAKTLHSLGYSFIRRSWGNAKPDDKVEYDRVKAVMGEQSPEQMQSLVVKLVSKLKNCAPFANLQGAIEVAENFDLTPDESWEKDGWDEERIAKYALAALEAAKTADKQGRISFDDMVYLPVVCNMVRPWFDMVVVDEAQDMNVCQLIMAQRACKRGGRIVVVGDDRQAIYAFRGADAGSLDRLKTELSATELGLTITYRCPKTVVALAQGYVPDYQAAPSAPEGEVVECQYEQMFDRAQIGDFVLSRKNAPLMNVCLAFLRRGVRARVEGRDVGQGLLSIIKKLRARSMPNFFEKLTSWKERETKRAQARDNTVAVDRIADQYETLVALAEGLASVREVETRIDSLFSDADKNPLPAIVCSSVHKAKGLETEQVFVLKETLFPGKRGGIEEENIAYVAYTRAKGRLVLVHGLGKEKK